MGSWVAELLGSWVADDDADEGRGGLEWAFKKIEKIQNFQKESNAGKCLMCDFCEIIASKI